MKVGGRSAATLGLVLLLLLATANRGWSWEPDVHYALTYWLAIEAGVAPAAARLIALGDEDMDEGRYLPAIWGVALHVIVDGDERASRAIRITHFLSDHDVPALPKERPVTRNNKMARYEVERRLQLGPNEDLALRLLGQVLHTLQDTWSHEGEPEVPLSPCTELRPLLSWGHAKARGGWATHDADLTPVRQHATGAVEMAQVTHDFLTRFAAANPKLKTLKGPPRPWAQLQPIVDGFAKAKTRKEKFDWIQNFIKPTDHPQAFGEARGFLATGSTLPGDVPGAPAAPVQRVPPNVQGPVAPGGYEVLVGFLDDLIVKKRIGDALERVALGAISETCGALQAFKQRGARDWLARALTSFLLKDHGRVNAMGHADPSDPRYRDLPSDPAEAGSGMVNDYPSLDQALVGPDGGGPLFTAVTNTEGSAVPNGVAVLFRFRDKPRDDLLLIAAQQDDRWRIVRFVWSTR